MYVHMELFSKAVVDVEPFEIDDHLFNIFFLLLESMFFYRLWQVSLVAIVCLKIK